MKKVKLLSAFLLIVILLTISAPAAAALDAPQITSRAVLLVDINSGRELFSNNPDMRAEPASLTKIMTALLAIEAVEQGTVTLADPVTASNNILFDMIDDGSTSNIVPGETMTLENLLYCILLESANEGCNVIAEYIGGTVTGFLNMMNDRAAALGCMNTHFANTHGLPDPNHYTTARDMYLITNEAIKHELFMDICTTVKHTVPATNVAEERQLSNSNGLINAESKYYAGYYYEHARGVKTGFTNNAGYCLISTAKKDNINMLAVVMGGAGSQNPDGSLTFGCFVDTITLYDWVFNNFSYLEILGSAELVAEVDVELASDGAKAMLRPQEVLYALLPNDTDLKGFERKITVFSETSGEPLKAPVAAGQVLGEISIVKDGVVYGVAPLVSNASVEMSKSEFIRTQLNTVLNLVWVKIILWVLLLALLGYVLLVIRYRMLHKKHLESVRRARIAREQRRLEEERTRIIGGDYDQVEPQNSMGSKKGSAGPRSGGRDINEVRGDRNYFEDFFREDIDRKK